MAVELVPDVANAVIGIVLIMVGSVVMVLLAIMVLFLFLVLLMVLVLFLFLVLLMVFLLCASANREKEQKTVMITIVYEYA